MRNINNDFEVWLKTPDVFTEKEKALFQAYADCVINNETTSGSFRATMDLTDLFEEILNKI